MTSVVSTPRRASKAQHDERAGKAAGVARQAFQDALDDIGQPEGRQRRGLGQERSATAAAQIGDGLGQRLATHQPVHDGVACGGFPAKARAVRQRQRSCPRPQARRSFRCRAQRRHSRAGFRRSRAANPRASPPRRSSLGRTRFRPARLRHRRQDRRRRPRCRRPALPAVGSTSQPVRP